MNNFCSILENQKISEAYRNIYAIEEGIETKNTLKSYPKYPINIFNKRIPRSKRFDDSRVIDTLTVPSSMFSLKSNSDIQIAFMDNGKAKLTFEYDGTELDAFSQKILNTILSHNNDKNKFISIFNEPERYEKDYTSDDDVDFILNCEELTDEQKNKIQSWIDMTDPIFYPTVIDVIRIYDANGEPEIPSSILIGCNNVDNSPDTIIQESYSTGELLASYILTSKHRIGNSGIKDFFYNVKPHRANIIRNVMNRDVGNPCFIYNSDSSNEYSKDGLTIITDRGVVVAFKDKEGHNCISGYFASPTEVIREITKWGDRVNNSTEWGSSHTVSKIPVSLLKNCIYNEINGYCGVDGSNPFRTNNTNCRRYIECNDNKKMNK